MFELKTGAFAFASFFTGLLCSSVLFLLSRSWSFGPNVKRKLHWARLLAWRIHLLIIFLCGKFHYRPLLLLLRLGLDEPFFLALFILLKVELAQRNRGKVLNRRGNGHWGLRGTYCDVGRNCSAVLRVEVRVFDLHLLGGLLVLYVDGNWVLELLN